MTRYLIVDDEPIAHGIIEDYAEALTSLEKVGNCYNAMEAISVLQKEKVDLVFLDINMPRLSGFDLLKTLSVKPRVIVTSAYQEYALEGYELEIEDYLLKPFSLERFLKAVNKATKELSPPTVAPTQSATAERVFIREDRKSRQISLRQIQLVEAYGNYCKVHLARETILTPEKISHFEAILPQADFIRVHKSFIISAQHIKAVEGNKLNVMDRYIPIGQTYMAGLKDRLGL